MESPAERGPTRAVDLPDARKVQRPARASCGRTPVVASFGAVRGRTSASEVRDPGGTVRMATIVVTPTTTPRRPARRGWPGGVQRWRAGLAFALAVEDGDWQRFTSRSIGSFVGLVRTEHSSGQSRSQEPITKTGNGHARRLLTESAWHHRSPYRQSKAIASRCSILTRATGNEAGSSRSSRPSLTQTPFVAFPGSTATTTVAGSRATSNADMSASF